MVHGKIDASKDRQERHFGLSYFAQFMRWRRKWKRVKRIVQIEYSREILLQMKRVAIKAFNGLFGLSVSANDANLFVFSNFSGWGAKI